MSSVSNFMRFPAVQNFWKSVNAHRFPRVSWGAFSSTVTFYSATCTVLYMQLCIRLNYRNVSACVSSTDSHTTYLDCNCDNQTLAWTKVADDSAYSSANPPFSVVDGDHRGRLAQILVDSVWVGDFSVGKKRNIYLLRLQLAPPLHRGDSFEISLRSFAS